MLHVNAEMLHLNFEMLHFNFEMLRFNFEMLRFKFEMLGIDLKCLPSMLRTWSQLLHSVCGHRVIYAAVTRVAPSLPRPAVFQDSISSSHAGEPGDETCQSQRSFAHR